MTRRGSTVLVAIVLSTLAVAGCLGQGKDRIIKSGEEERLHGVVEIAGDLVVEDGGHLNIENARVIVHGSIRVTGELVASDSDLIIRPEGRARVFEVTDGSVSIIDTNIVKADAVILQQAVFSMQGGVLIFGRFLSTDSAVVLKGIETEATSEPVGSYQGSARHEFHGNSRANIADSIATGTYYASEESTIGFLNTSVNLFALDGPGAVEVSYRLHLRATYAGGAPASNVSVDVFAVPLATTDDANVTDEAGRALLIQLTAERQGGELIVHDPHVVRADGLPVGATIAYRDGDTTLDIIVPG